MLFVSEAERSLTVAELFRSPYKRTDWMNKMGSSRLKLLLMLAILAPCIGCDQATKTIATRTLADGPPKSFLADTVRLDYALNPGGFLSFGSDFPPSIRTGIFTGFTSCLMLGLAAFLFLKRSIPLTLYILLVFILAGGIGNLIDRVFNGGLVIDFLNVGIGSFRTGIFNVADVAVMIGAIGAVYVSFRHDVNKSSD